MSSGKICTKCKVFKPYTDYSLRRDTACGLQSHCKDCVNARAAKYRDKKRKYDVERHAKKGDEINAKKRESYARNPARYVERTRVYRQRNKERWADYDRERILTVRARAGRLFNTARRTSVARGLSFNIVRIHVEGLLAIGRCAVSNIPFVMTAGKRNRTHPFAPSLDRIDNERGYEPDNIQIVCFMFNAGKNHNTEIEFLALCSAIHLRHGQKPEVIEKLKELFNASSDVSG